MTRIVGVVTAEVSAVNCECHQPALGLHQVYGPVHGRISFAHGKGGPLVRIRGQRSHVAEERVGELDGVVGGDEIGGDCDLFEGDGPGDVAVFTKPAKKLCYLLHVLRGNVSHWMITVLV